MPILIFKVKNYRNESAVDNLVSYINDSPYYECKGSNGCFLYPDQCTSENVKNSFNAIKNVYHKNDGQLVQHIIVGLGDLKGITEWDARLIAVRISDYFFLKGFQSFWGVHWGGDNSHGYWHIHLAVNTVNGMTGLRYAATNTNMNDLKEYLMKIFPELFWQYQESESFYMAN